MKSLFPTSYFGNINYYKELANFDSVLIESKEHFLKQTFRNRCEILTPNGVQSLSIPVNRSNGSKTVIEEVEISFLSDWRKDHWKAIESAYASSPYFEHYDIEVYELIYQNEKNLLQYNLEIQKRIMKWLDITVNLEFSKEFRGDFEDVNDFRLSLSNKKQSKNADYSYIQVFNDKIPFTQNLSILDAIFCIGPMARAILINQ